MIRDRRLLVCALLSLAGHLAFAGGLRRLPPRSEGPPRRVVSIRVISPPPAPQRPPEPAEVPASVPTSVPRARSRPRPAPRLAHDVRPENVAAPDRQPTEAATPVFGVTLESTSQAGRGPALPAGSATGSPGPPAAGQGAANHLASPVAAYEVTTMPLPQGRCAGRYTEQARLAAIEGTVVLDLVVGDNGRVREIEVVSGLGHGLTAAAITALRECRFSPGEKDGVPVSVRLRGFKIRFVLQSNE